MRKTRESSLIVGDQSVVIFAFVIDLSAGHMFVFVAVAAYSENAYECHEEQSLEHDVFDGLELETTKKVEEVGFV